MRRGDLIVYLIVALAVLTAVIAAAFENGEPEDTVLGPAPAAAAGVDLGDLRGPAITVSALPPHVTEQLLDACFAVHPDADPALSPDRSTAVLAATGTAAGAGVALWVGPAPGEPTAMGACVGLEQGPRWVLIGRSLHADTGAPSLVWGPSASDDGAAASVSGRVAGGATDAFVFLGDGRVLHQHIADGFVAVAWQPVTDPRRLVLVGGDGRIVYDGTVSGYG